MKFNLFFHHFSSKNFRSEDYFKDILSQINKTEYPYNASDIGVIYLPVEFADIEDVRRKGYQLIDRKTHLGDRPHYIIRELVVTFTGLTEDADFQQDRDHLIDTFGKPLKAFKYQIIEEGLINV